MLPRLRISQRCGSASFEHQTRGKTNVSSEAQHGEEKIQPSSNHLIWSRMAAEKTWAESSGGNTSLFNPQMHYPQEQDRAPFLQPHRSIWGLEPAPWSSESIKCMEIPGLETSRAAVTSNTKKRLSPVSWVSLPGWIKLHLEDQTSIRGIKYNGECQKVGARKKECTWGNPNSRKQEGKE